VDVDVAADSVAKDLTMGEPCPWHHRGGVGLETERRQAPPHQQVVLRPDHQVEVVVPTGLATSKGVHAPPAGEPHRHPRRLEGPDEPEDPGCINPDRPPFEPSNQLHPLHPGAQGGWE